MERWAWVACGVVASACASGVRTELERDSGPVSTPGSGTGVAGSLPQIVLSVDGGLDPDDEPGLRDWMPAGLKVLEEGVVLHDGRAGVHVRGNSSRDYDKKSYALETWNGSDEDLDVSLLGMPSEEDWVLQGPYSDKTLLRNHLAYALYRDLGRYAARTRFVEVTVNDDYRGIYVLMEKIKRDSTRMDLPEGAVLLKRDWVEGGPAFIETALCEDTLKVDWPDDTEGILPRVDAAEAALLAGDHRKVDLESFVDHMLMVELGRNVDGYVLSTWITLSDGDVLGMGPVWDYNGALGNADYFEAWDPEGWHHENPEFPADNPRGFCWYEALLADADFLELRKERWRAHRSGPWSDESIARRIDEAVAVLAPSVGANFDRWPVLGEYVWPNDEGHADRTSHAEEVAYLKSWLVARAAWLDSQL